MAGRGDEGAVWHAWVGPTDRRSEFRGFGATGRGGLKPRPSDGSPRWDG